MIKRILIVDDDKEYVEELNHALKEEGYDVDQAYNGIIGCDACHVKSYDLVIMDLFLPEKDGVQSIKEIKEAFSSDIKIIAISGAECSIGTTEYIFRQSQNYGADAVLRKPFKINELLNVITSFNE